MNTFLNITLEIAIVLGLVAANGFFVAAEFALVKVRASQLRPLAKTGGWQVRFALKATEKLDAALSATQLGITLASLGLGWLGEPVVAHRLEPLLTRWGVTDPAAVQSISFAVGFAVITFLHIIFGELAPKSLAIQRAKGVALKVSAPLMFFYYLLFPFIWLLNGTANACLRLIGLPPTTEGEHAFSPDELEYVLTNAHHPHPSDALVNKLMVQSLRLRDTTAQQIMLPVEKVVALWTDKPVADNLRIAQTSGHSRFPICSGSLDNVQGIVLVREWLWQLHALGPETSFEPLIRPTLTFEKKTPLPIMMEKFRSSRNHLAVVVDENKRLAGIVAFEDVLEEIVGDIRDELDISRGPIYERTDTAIVVSGTLTMRELRAETGWTFEWQPRENVAQWTTRHHGRTPLRNETITVGDFQVTILDVSAERIRRLKIEKAVSLE